MLKYGSYIVDRLRVYKQPVFVYLPKEAELRGGAWVVLDPTINPSQMEMYASESCRGGVLEPECMAHMKFKDPDLIKMMQRLNPELSSLPEEERLARECQMLPAYRQLAVTFAALHDTPAVMLHKKVIKDIVPWAESRTFFTRQLRRRLAQEAIKRKVIEIWPGAAMQIQQQAVTELKENWEAEAFNSGQIAIVESANVKTYMTRLRIEYISSVVTKLAQEDPETVQKALAAALGQ